MSNADGGSNAPLTDRISVLLVGSLDVELPTAEFRTTTAVSARDAYEWLADQPGSVDCVVSAYELPDMDGISFLETVGQTVPAVPFVLVVCDGNESIAAQAVSADVDEYVPVGDSDPEAIDDRVREAVATAALDRRRRRRAAAFEAVFDDPSRYVWVLNPDGTVRRSNGTAVETLPAGQSVPDGKPLWEWPWWDDEQPAGDRIERCIRDAIDGGTQRTELRFDGADRPAIDLVVRPIVDATGAVDRLIAEGIDVSERTELERELRRSEELHRVTLNNMTDTVLVVDNDGEFTYICPNVHFIFGYSVEDIEAMGTYDELLGENLFDREALEQEGVLTNIETTATDSAGNEHTLLVNVRRVAIQDGTTLISCRDITERKRRERALAALHDTAQSLLYAETREEIAREVATDATDVLEGIGSAVFVFDSDDGVLHPAATGGPIEQLHGPLSTVIPGEGGIVGDAFVSGEPTVYDDLRDSDRLDNPTTDVRSALLIPLSEHGVLVLVADQIDAFDDHEREVAELLAATAEAALDRVEREAQLRERDRELQQQNQQLTRLNRTNEIIRAVDQALVRADSRTAIEQAVCERLTGEDRFAFAWIGRVVDDTIEPSAWAGDGADYLDVIDLRRGSNDGEPAVTTATAGGPTVVPSVGQDLAAGAWRRAALARGFQSVVSVPLSYDGYSAGVLTAYATEADALDETTRDVLYELGETIATAVQSTERKAALLDDTVVELEYQIDDPQSMLRELARTVGGPVELEGGVRSTAAGTRMLVSVTDTTADAVVSAFDELVTVGDVRLVANDDHKLIVQVTLVGSFVGDDLAERGAALRTFRATPDGVTLLVDVPQSIEPRRVDDQLAERYDSVALVAQRTRDRPVMTDSQFRDQFLSAITDRQLEVIQTAYYSGYFESPRAASGETIADTLGISPSAFYSHVRTVQATLFATLFDDRGDEHGG